MILLKRLWLLLFTLSVTSCTSWRGRADELRHPLLPRDQVKIWVAGQGHQVHGVRVIGDSVLSVPFIQPPGCDSCLLRFALRDVDSVQVTHFDGSKSFFLLLVLSPVIYVMVIAIGMGIGGNN